MTSIDDSKNKNKSQVNYPSNSKVPNAIILETFEFQLKFEFFSNFKPSELLIESAYKITLVS